MLSSGKVTNGAYYSELANAASDDYYNKAQHDDSKEPAGYWVDSSNLNLHGEVSKKDFALLAGGYNPEDGNKLTRNAGRVGDKGHVIAHDFCFSSPKSVSILKFTTTPEMHDLIQKAEKEALQNALSDMAELVEVRKTTIENQQAVGCTFAVYEHSTARARDEFTAPDPQSHYHAVLLNIAERADGKFGCIDYKSLYDNKHLIDGIYMSNLAHNLRELGFSIDKKPFNNFEIAGVPQAMIDHYSKRSKQISDAIDSGGLQGTAKDRAFKAMATRQNKKEVTLSDAQKKWQLEAKRLFGFDLSKVPRGQSQQQTAAPISDLDCIKRAAALSNSKFGSFEPKHLHRALAEQAVGNGRMTLAQIQKRTDEIMHHPSMKLQTKTFKDRFGREQTKTFCRSSEVKAVHTQNWPAKSKHQMPISKSQPNMPSGRVKTAQDEGKQNTNADAKRIAAIGIIGSGTDFDTKLIEGIQAKIATLHEKKVKIMTARIASQGSGDYQSTSQLLAQEAKIDMEILELNSAWSKISMQSMEQD